MYPPLYSTYIRATSRHHCGSDIGIIGCKGDAVDIPAMLIGAEGLAIVVRHSPHRIIRTATGKDNPPRTIGDTPNIPVCSVKWRSIASIKGVLLTVGSVGGVTLTAGSVDGGTLTVGGCGDAKYPRRYPKGHSIR